MKKNFFEEKEKELFPKKQPLVFIFVFAYSK